MKWIHRQYDYATHPGNRVWGSPNRRWRLIYWGHCADDRPHRATGDGGVKVYRFHRFVLYVNA
jgi:hypothetical protein